jgi:hypothetical protein
MHCETQKMVSWKSGEDTRDVTECVGNRCSEFGYRVSMIIETVSGAKGIILQQWLPQKQL